MVSESYNQSYKSISPGSLMIMGEHAILYGAYCLVTAINKFLKVKLNLVPKKTDKTQVFIKTNIDKFSKDSATISSYNFYLELNKDLVAEGLDQFKPFDYIIAVIHYFKDLLLELNTDYIFTIDSDINPHMGLGSSAALVSAAVAVISKCLVCNGLKINPVEEKLEILEIGHKIIKQVQGSGSAADLAASIYGGVLYYKTDGYKVEKIRYQGLFPLVVVYSGYKLSTKIVVDRMAQIIADKNNSFVVYSKIFDLINLLVAAARASIMLEDWLELGKLCDQHYGLQEALGVSDKKLSEIIYKLRESSGISGAKISGSGLGDCVIGIGEYDNNQVCKNGLNILDVQISYKGLQ